MPQHGTRIVSGSYDNTVRIWDATTGIQVGRSLQGPADFGKSAAFSPDGTRIVSDSRDRTLRIFHATPAISVQKIINSSLHPFDPIASVSLMFSTTIGGNGTFQSTNELGQVLFSVNISSAQYTLDSFHRRVD
ncbi:hypothetical protein D9757_013549 [Collybiopsis confluens]|uniref:Uncharacterized protein n=1 Tax=Collybiopsis confluens TaxID=2823264 RepID=A0A8H5GAH3_9AGAR|nr:hypothetical protein D9757_013549 [Collybiopsis confluens]